MHLTSYKTVFANGILNEQRPEYPPDFLFLCKSTQMTVTVTCVTDVCVRWLLTLQSDYILMLTVAQSYASFFIDPAKMSNVQIQPVSFQLCNYNYLKLVKFSILYTAKKLFLAANIKATTIHNLTTSNETLGEHS